MHYLHVRHATSSWRTLLLRRYTDRVNLFASLPKFALMVLIGSSLDAVAQGPQEQAQELATAGQQALAQGRYIEAQDAFQKLAHLQPSIAEVHASLAAIDFKLRQYESAITEIQTALRLKPALPRLDSLLGLALAEQGRFADALPHLEKGFKQGSDTEVHRLCGLQLMRTYSNLNRDADAVNTALQLNKLFPDDPEVLYNTGRIYGNHAYTIMLRLHDQAPNSIWMLQAQGEANESQKQYEGALAAFQHVLELDPHRPGIHYRMGRVYLARFNESQNSEDRDGAMREFLAELANDPNNGNARYEIAVMDASQGNLDDARTQYQEILNRYPEFEEALVGLAGIELDSRQAANAVPLLERATKLRPLDEVSWYRLAQAQRAVGNKSAQETALAQFRKLHKSTPVTLRAPDADRDVTPQKIGQEAPPAP